MNDRAQKLHERLRQSQQEVLDMAAAFDETSAQGSLANPGWTVRDLMAHLASAELGHCHVIRRLLAGQPTSIPGFNLDAFNHAEVDIRRERSLTELLAEYTTNRAATLVLLESIGVDDWDKAGPHPGGFETTVEGVFRVISLHEKRHLKELRTMLDARLG